MARAAHNSTVIGGSGMMKADMSLNKSVDEPLGVLLEEHESLSRLFECHQRALLGKDIDNAVLILSKFHDDLSRHIRFEESYVLPKYAEEGGETPGGTLAIFQAEHRKLRDMTDSLKRATLRLYSASDLDAQTIAILDQETTFKGLFKHHALREQNILFPGLEARTTKAERKEMLEKHAALEPRLNTASREIERFADPFASVV
jgi:hemerythrin-like domain-containing protein